MGIESIAIIFVYLCLMLMAGLLAQELLYKGKVFKKYFLLGFVFKLTGAFLFCAIYLFYYGNGDTLAYHRKASRVQDLLEHNFELGWRVLKAEPGSHDFATIDVTNQIGGYFNDQSTLVVVKFASVLGLFCFGNFWVVSLFFAALSFSGLWAMYLVFLDRYPNLYKPMAWAVFFVPSLFFWGSGLMKDTLTMGALGWLFYGSYQLFIKKEDFWFNIPLVFIMLSVIASLKAYIVAAFVPAFFMYVVLYHFKAISELRLRSFVLASTVVLLGSFIFYFRDSVQGVAMAGFEKFIDMAMGFQTYHEFLAATQGQSGYTLGEMEFTIAGILAKFPQAVNVTFFRPYLFEVRNPVMLLTSLESTFFLFATIWVFLRVGFIRTFGWILRVPFIFFCVAFAVAFAFAVGLTSYNFGALARYKIPCLPFYLGALVAIYYEWKSRKDLQFALQERTPE